MVDNWLFLNCENSISYDLSSVQFSSDAQSCLTLCDPMDYSTPGFPVHHQLLELAQTHVHQVHSCPSNSWYHPTISSSVNLFSFWLQSFPASGYFLMSWLFASSGQSMGASTSTSVLPVNIQDWFSLGLTGVIILLFKGLSRVFSNTTAQKHQFFGTQPSLLSNSYIHTWLLEKSQLWLYKSLSAKSSLCFLICFLDLS